MLKLSFSSLTWIARLLWTKHYKLHKNINTCRGHAEKPTGAILLSLKILSSLSSWLVFPKAYRITSSSSNAMFYAAGGWYLDSVWVCLCLGWIMQNPKIICFVNIRKKVIPMNRKSCSKLGKWKIRARWKCWKAQSASTVNSEFVSFLISWSKRGPYFWFLETEVEAFCCSCSFTHLLFHQVFIIENLLCARC